MINLPHSSCRRLINSSFQFLFLMTLLHFQGKAQDPDPLNHFVTTWQTTGSNTDVTIPTNGTGYNYYVQWETGGTWEGPFTGDATHDYGAAESNTVRISGDFPMIYFGIADDNELIQSIDQWGDIEWTLFRYAFFDCSNLVCNALDEPDLTMVSDMSDMFRNCFAFNGNLSSWDVSNVTDMSFMFNNCTSFNGDISSWDVSNVANMSYMFNNCTSFNGDISSWDVSGVYHMSSMFYGASDFNQDISNWNTSNVSHIYGMFKDASAFNQNIGNWDLSNIVDMSTMLDNCGMDVNNYDNTLIGWANDNGGTQTIPTGINLGANNIEYCSGFAARSSLINNYNWTINGDEVNCDTDTQTFVTTWETSVANTTLTIPTAGSCYYYVMWSSGSNWSGPFTGNASHLYSNAGIHEIRICGYFPRIYFNNSGDKDLIRSIEQWGINNWTSMYRAFFGCSNLVYNALDKPDLSIVTDLSYMFAYCIAFNGNISSWDVSNVINMNGMFSHASSFNGDISTWDVLNVNNMSSMFSFASSFNGDLSTWDVSNVVDMGDMFNHASSFNGDISSWNVSNVTNMSQMFYSTSAFNQNLATWDISSVTAMSNMLSNSGIDPMNYDNTLIGWADDNGGTQSIPSGISLDAYGMTYCQGLDARSTLETTYGWQITGDALDCSDDVNHFVTTWETTIGNTQITIPTTGTGYNYYVFWGDVSGWAGPYTGNASHDYGMAGTWEVRISGDFHRIYFNNAGDKDLIQSIDQWGDIEWTSMEYAFYGCASMGYSATDNPDLSSVTSLAGMFGSCSVFNGDISNWYVSNINDMTGLFYNASSFNQDLSSWDVSSVQYMGGMFQEASSFNGNISNWDVSNLENGHSMFKQASSFNVDLSNWVVSKVEIMTSMFYEASSFNQSLGNWDISGLGDWYNSPLTGMLSYCGMSVSNYDNTLIGWADDNGGTETIPNGIGLGAYGLEYCNSLLARLKLNLDHNWFIDGDTESANCEADLTHFVMTLYTQGPENAVIPTTGGGYHFYVNWGDSNDWEGPFTSSPQHSYSSSGQWQVRIVGDFPRIYYYNSGYSGMVRSIDQWGDNNWTSMNGAFYDCDFMYLYNATDFPDLTSVSDLSFMFKNCVFFDGDINGWDVSNVTDMKSMFEDASSFNQDISDWDVSNVENMQGMFSSASAFNQSLGNWDISSITTMQFMLNNCGMNMENYDNTLIGWADDNFGTETIPSGITLGASNLEYCNGFMARDFLVDDQSWTINGDAINCNMDTRNFVTTWETSTDNTTITIPTNGTGYQYFVMWSPGTSWDGPYAWDASHEYPSPDTYEIRITGDFPAIYFNNSGDKDLITSIDQWGDNVWSGMDNAFYGCNYLTYSATDIPDLSSVTDLSAMFRDCPAFNGNLSSWDVGTVTDMNYMFHNASVFNQNLGTWDVSQVTDFSYLFNKASAFDQNLGTWDISSATDMTSMLDNSNLSTTNYDNTMIGWADDLGGTQTIPSGVTLGSLSLEYCNALAERYSLIYDHGWTIDDDVLGCPCKWVINTDDSGQGSLRFALGCSVPGNDLIRFSPALQNMVIELTSDPLAFAHDTELISSLADNITIDGSTIDHLFDIDLGRSVHIQGLSFNCGQSNSVSCFTNNGELELKDCHFTDSFSGPAAKGIQNNDDLKVEGEVKLLK
jgi:surface protein